MPLELAFGKGCDTPFALKAMKNLKAACSQLEPNGAVGFDPSITPGVRSLTAPSMRLNIDGSSWALAQWPTKQTLVSWCNLESEHKHFR